MAEEWRTVPEPNLSNYEVSNWGRVRHKQTQRVKVAQRNRNRNGSFYLYVMLWYGHRKHKKRYIHRLVAAAFLEKGKDATEVDHVNADPTDNRASNLQWVTRQQNQALAAARLTDAV